MCVCCPDVEKTGFSSASPLPAATAVVGSNFVSDKAFSTVFGDANDSCKLMSVATHQNCFCPIIFLKLFLSRWSWGMFFY
jgi:hypothetical protein